MLNRFEQIRAAPDEFRNVCVLPEVCSIERLTNTGIGHKLADSIICIRDDMLPGVEITPMVANVSVL